MNGLIMKKLGKIRKKQWNVYSTYQWFNILPIGGIRQDIENDHKIFTPNTVFCIYLNDYYYGLDLFKKHNIEQLKQWKFLYKLTGVIGIVININSIGDKYKIGVCRLE